MDDPVLYNRVKKIEDNYSEIFKCIESIHNEIIEINTKLNKIISTSKSIENKLCDDDHK